ncbi:uncharacterized protein LOC113338794 [Papaver somniferum]|uniref:uncharacterized protein LOC113338794 n=1 Tax=Papaver somniferum TaxID=3469 RepID=UPI000E6FA127|nr:uncharacterized protein LOC113338794 [Papaver somniferum]
MALRTAVSFLSRRLSAVVDRNFRGKGVSSEDIKPKIKDTELQSLYEKIMDVKKDVLVINAETQAFSERLRKKSQKGVKDIIKRPVIFSLGSGFLSHFWFKYKLGEGDNLSGPSYA